MGPPLFSAAHYPLHDSCGYEDTETRDARGEARRAGAAVEAVFRTRPLVGRGRAQSTSDADGREGDRAPRGIRRSIRPRGRGNPPGFQRDRARPPRKQCDARVRHRDPCRQELQNAIGKSFVIENRGRACRGEGWALSDAKYHVPQPQISGLRDQAVIPRRPPIRGLSRKIRRLIITLPPGTLKSLCASVALPAWFLGHYPSERVVVVSYSD